MRSPREKITTDGNGFRFEYTLDADETVNMFSNGMLTHNDIKGILGYVYDAGSGARRLCFAQPGGTPLSLLMGQAMNKHVILSILGSVERTIRRADEYMLDESGFLLDPEFIFVNISTLDAELIYIPTGIPCECPFWSFVRAMLVSGIVNTTENTAYVQEILNFINTNHPVSSVRLGEFIASAAEKKNVETVPFAAPQANFAVVAAPEKPFPAASDVHVLQPVPVSASARVTDIQTASHVSEETAPKKSGLFSGLMGKKKADKIAKAEKNAMPASGGFGFSIPGQSPSALSVPPEAPVQPAVLQPETKPGGLAAKFGRHKNDAVQPAAAVPRRITVPVYAAAEPQSDEETYGGRTVLLEPDEEKGAGAERAFFLEGKNGERIPINKSMFFIGKADRSDIPNDYIIRNNAVSRNHAYFQLNAGGAAVTDNNSSNGTFVNDERIPGLVRRELKDGDVIRFANETFVFRIQ